MRAASAGHYTPVKLLLEAGADKNAKRNPVRSVLQNTHVVEEFEGNTALFEPLVNPVLEHMMFSRLCIFIHSLIAIVVSPSSIFTCLCVCLGVATKFTSR